MQDCRSNGGRMTRRLKDRKRRGRESNERTKHKASRVKTAQAECKMQNTKRWRIQRGCDDVVLSPQKSANSSLSFWLSGTGVRFGFESG